MIGSQMPMAPTFTFAPGLAIHQQNWESPPPLPPAARDWQILDTCRFFYFLSTDSRVPRGTGRELYAIPRTSLRNHQRASLYIREARAGLRSCCAADIQGTGAPKRCDWLGDLIPTAQVQRIPPRGASRRRAIWQAATPYQIPIAFAAAAGEATNLPFRLLSAATLTIQRSVWSAYMNRAGGRPCGQDGDRQEFAVQDVDNRSLTANLERNAP